MCTTCVVESRRSPLLDGFVPEISPSITPLQSIVPNTKLELSHRYLSTQTPWGITLRACKSFTAPPRLGDTGPDISTSIGTTEPVVEQSGSQFMIGPALFETEDRYYTPKRFPASALRWWARTLRHSQFPHPLASLRLSKPEQILDKVIHVGLTVDKYGSKSMAQVTPVHHVHDR